MPTEQTHDSSTGAKPALPVGEAALVHRHGGVLTWIGAIGFYWFFLTAFWGVDGHYFAMFLLGIYFISWSRTHWPVVVKSKLAWLVVSLFLYFSLRYLYSFFLEGASFEWNIGYEWPFLKAVGLTAFLLVPFFLSESRRKYLNRAFLLLLASWVIKIILELFVHETAGGLSTLSEYRPGFGMGPITFGAVTGFLILGVVALSSSFVDSSSGQSSSNLAKRAAVGILLALLFTGLILTQSVGDWLAMGIALLVLWALKLKRCRSKEKSAGCYKRHAIYSLAIAVMILAVIGAKWDVIESRLQAKNLDYTTLATTPIGQLPETALGVRYDLYRVGLNNVGTSPVFGILPSRVEKQLKAQTPYRWRHVHNLPLQILLSFGAVGLALFVTLFITSFREMVMASMRGALPDDWSLFWYAAVAFFIVQTSFDISINNADVRTLLVMLAGLAMAMEIERKMGHLRT